MAKYFGFDMSDHNPYDFADKIRDKMDIDKDKYPNMYRNIIYATMVLFRNMIQNYYPPGVGIRFIDDLENLRLCYLAQLDKLCVAYFNNLHVPYLDELVEDHCSVVVHNTDSDDVVSQEVVNYLGDNRKWLVHANYEWLRVYRYRIGYMYRDELTRIKMLSLYIKDQGSMVDFHSKKWILRHIDEFKESIVNRELNTSNDANIRETIEHVLTESREESELNILNMKCNIPIPERSIDVHQFPEYILKCEISYEMIS